MGLIPIAVSEIEGTVTIAGKPGGKAWVFVHRHMCMQTHTDTGIHMQRDRLAYRHSVRH